MESGEVENGMLYHFVLKKANPKEIYNISIYKIFIKSSVVLISLN